MKIRRTDLLLLLLAGAAHGIGQALSPSETTAGWTLLFDGKSPNGWKAAQGTSFPKTGWVIENGVLTVMAGSGGGDIVTAEQYGSFELSLEFRLTPGANSGIKYFVQP
jgi:hypothetical protein